MKGHDMKRTPFLLAALTAVLLGGCTLAPEYTRPAAPVPAQWPTGEAYGDAASMSPAAGDLPWREVFTDPRLQQVISMALANNRDLRLAALNVERAREIGRAHV